ncbi:hypothetical protein LTR85_000942 [Meristemomyces frigidus]|nr:hypothetical protein LTR85_000942 [Meristemomyces frigidus]
MEPEEKYFDPFIKPLLDQPGSTYRYTSLSGAHPARYWDTWKTVMDDPNLLPPSALAPQDPRRRQFDPSVLVIGNLARKYQDTSRRGNSVHYSIMILQQMALAALRGDMVHRDGLVRMLWWAPESEAYLAFPNTEVFRHNLNATLSMGVTMNMVFGIKPPAESGGVYHQSARKRSLAMNTMLASRIERSMLDKGMQRPESRDFLIPIEDGIPSAEPAKDSSTWDADGAAKPRRAGKAKASAGEEAEQADEQANERPTGQRKHPSNLAMTQRVLEGRELEIVNPLIPTISTVHELRAEVADARARVTTIIDFGLTGKSGLRYLPATEVGLLQSLSYPQCGALAGSFAPTKARVSCIAIASDMTLRIVKLEASYKMLADSGEDKASLDVLRDEIVGLGDEFESWLATQSRLKDQGGNIVDSQIAFFSSPPLLALDAREYEPLKAESHEFWPRNDLMLVDMVPKVRDLSVPDLATAGDSVKVAQMLLKALMEARAQTLPFTFERVAPNAAQDLIPQVPAITDPRQGGRLNPNNVRTRMISESMIEGLVKAWAEWPFKPSTLELELAAENFGSASEPAEGSKDAESVFSEQ